MQIKITSVVSRNAGEDIDVTFELTSDGGEHTARETFVITSKQYLMLGVVKGDSNEEKYDQVQHAADIRSALKKGIALLGYGSCSEKALRMKLVSKGFEREIVAQAVDEIVALGLLCADDDASREAEKLSAKLWGKKRIIAELYHKGYDTDAITSAMERLENDGIDYAENCAKLIRKSYSRVLGDPAAQKKMYAALMRYGYTSSQIKDALSITNK